MADPLSITASILGVASAGIKLSTTLYSYTTTIINADKNIKIIARDLSITSSAIKELGALLGNDIEGRSQCESILVTARDAVEGCDAVFREIQKELDKSIDLDSRGKTTMSKLKRLKWPLVEPKLQTLQVRLERLKNTLVLVLNVVSYAKNIGRTEDALPQHAFRPVDRQCQIERLISLSEEANERSQELEMLIRRLGLMHTSTEVPNEKGGTHISDQPRQHLETPLPKPGLRLRDDEIAPVSKSSSDASCICGHTNTPSERDFVHINRQDLDQCAHRLRALLKVVEDAQAVEEGTRKCEVVGNEYREILEALYNTFPGKPKRPSRLRRLLSRNSSSSHRTWAAPPKYAALVQRNPAESSGHTRPMLPDSSIRTRTTLLPTYEKPSSASPRFHVFS